MSIRTRLADWIRGETRERVASTRVRPGQQYEAGAWMYAPGAVQPRTLALAACNAWVWTAVTRLAEIAMTAELLVVGRDDKTQRFDEHPIRDLLGPMGMPNDAQDSLEFLELHYQFLDTAGQSYWHWVARGGGAPTEVYLLDPAQIKIIPGTSRTIAAYEYQVQGHRFEIDPQYITHIKRPSMYSIYYGLGAVQILELEILSDNSWRKWNAEYATVGAPSGIIILPEDTPTSEVERVDEEVNAEYSQRRKTMVMRAPVGGAVWNEAALKHHDLDFKEGRLLSRQIVFDALGLHTGLLSEASTEAHARVAERMVLKTAWTRHIRTASRLNNVLGFWPGSDRKQIVFEDVRVSDWQQESMKLKAVQPYMDVDEVRAKYLNLGAMPEKMRTRLDQAKARLQAAPGQNGGQDDGTADASQSDSGA